MTFCEYENALKPYMCDLASRFIEALAVLELELLVAAQCLPLNLF